MASAILISFVVGKRHNDGTGEALISIQASGPSGYWQFCTVTESRSLVRQIREMTVWSDLANQGSGFSDEDMELASFVPLEGGFELALISTPKGFVIEAREDDQKLDLRRHTRIHVSPEDITGFVDGMLACSCGDRMEVTIGEIDYFAETNPESVPMVRVFRDGLVELRNQPGQFVGLSINLDDLSFVRDILQSTSARLTSADGWSEPSKQTYWSPSAALRLETKIITDPESLQRYLDLTVCTSEHGALWTVPMARSEAMERIDSFSKDSESVVLYGRVLPALPV
ncbi:hypothetical protein [Arcanobacterium phocae]|uniref:hypothetical protein n=1 Tax=Arcanobacterium phocae TaxID=131112 RepID=UPI001C0EB350|nr:hypothetical protein [Arcanobacterium phocae]